jgi:hypothetical protein
LSNENGLIDSVEVIHKDKNGKIIRKHKLNSSLKHRFLVKLGLAHNSITQYGMAECARLVTGTGGIGFGFVAIGTGILADTVFDSMMGNEKKRKVVAATRVTTTYTNDTSQWVATFSSTDGLTGTDAIDEVGILNAATVGILYLHISGATNYGAADSCNWTNGDTLTLTVKCQQKQGV